MRLTAVNGALIRRRRRCRLRNHADNLHELLGAQHPGVQGRLAVRRKRNARKHYGVREFGLLDDNDYQLSFAQHVVTN
jgi:hypothetical protein